MNDLIQLAVRQVGDDTVQTASARDLHAFLEVGKDFSTWIKGRIEQYGFVDGRDFTPFDAGPQNGGAGNRGLRVEYAISLDMAKELAMVERNEKGRQARLYFIECERRAKALTPAIPQTMPEALRLAAQAMEDAERSKSAQLAAENQLRIESAKTEQLTAKVAEAAPKVAALDRIAASDGSFCLTDAAKSLQVSPRQFTAKLCHLGWIYRRPMGGIWLAHQDKINQLVLEHKVTTGEKSTGGEWTNTQVRVTAKGMAKLALIFEKEAVA